VLELPEAPSDRPWDKPENIEANLRQIKNALNYTREWAYISTSMPEFIRNNMYGPVYNLQSWIPPFRRKYVCSEMRRNIVGWLEKRRFRQTDESAGDAVKRIERMNGLDFGYYAIVPAHVWAGIFPAGADRFAEYRALDPWWGQKWRDDWRHPDNLLTQSDENARGVIFKALNIYLVGLLIQLIPALTITVVIESVRSWLRGNPPDHIRQIIGEEGFGAWYDSLQCDSDNVDAEGKYLEGIKRDVENWFPALIKDLG
jgi:hypothetical protein